MISSCARACWGIYTLVMINSVFPSLAVIEHFQMRNCQSPVILASERNVLICEMPNVI